MNRRIHPLTEEERRNFVAWIGDEATSNSDFLNQLVESWVDHTTAKTFRDYYEARVYPEAVCTTCGHEGSEHSGVNDSECNQRYDSGSRCNCKRFVRVA